MTSPLPPLLPVVQVVGTTQAGGLSTVVASQTVSTVATLEPMTAPASSGVSPTLHGSLGAAGSSPISRIRSSDSDPSANPPAPRAPEGGYQEPAPYRIDFTALGIVAPGATTAQNTSPARLNTLTYLLQREAAEGTLRLPKADSEYNEVFKGLLKAIGQSPKNFKLYVVESREPNAWWVRGTGAVCVTTALLRKPDLTAGNLAHVLGHELGHFLKSRPDAEVPARFKNPLFRRLMKETHAARAQNEEYQSDELGLLIADAAGHSVDEGIDMERWLAGKQNAKNLPAESGSKKSRPLSPGESHPHDDARLAALEETAEDPRFVWKNRNVAPRPLPYEATTLTSPRRKIKDFGYLNPESPGVAKEIAQNPRWEGGILTEENMVAVLYNAIAGKTYASTPEAQATVLRLRQEAAQGDLISRALLQAVLVDLYLHALDRGADEAAKALAWLKESCEISEEEVLSALIEYVESLAPILSEMNKKQDFDPSFEIGTYGFGLRKLVDSFRASALRDRLIGSLLKHFDLISDRNDFIEERERADVRLPLNFAALTSKGGKELVRLLHGLELLDVQDLIANTEELEHVLDVHNNDIDFTMDHGLFTMGAYIVAWGGPYDRGDWESQLSESVSVAATLGVKDPYFQMKLRNVYGLFLSHAARLPETFARERAETAARVLLLRYLEHLPAGTWEPETMALAVSLPASSERNHLLLILDQANLRPVSDDEMHFAEIPSSDAAGGSADLLHSFGFVDTGASEAIYPSGQRILDRSRANRFSGAGTVALDEVLKAIPRPSPIRDELLDRCEAAGTDATRALLDEYWSPAGAYAKAFQISSAWLKNSGGDRSVFENILAITAEFPSLRRRMVTEWTERFGIAAEDYEATLKAAQDVDAIDLYRGGAVEHSRKASQQEKVALSLASFASALSRGDHSLLSLQDVDVVKKVKRRRKEITSGANEEDGSLARKRALDQHRLFENYHPFLPEEASFLARLLMREARYEIHRIPFVDGKPVSNQRFARAELFKDGLTETSRWEGAKAFSRFMEAMGWEESVAFYEELLMGQDGALKSPYLFQPMEKLFIEGISLMLEEKGVPLSRVRNVQRGLQALLTHQPMEIRGRIWSRILAGIVQKNSLGEIVREAVRPLGAAAGGKLMQAVHSLTAGVDATLEEASRLALNQTANFTLFDSLQFLGSRGVKTFELHGHYRPLGQGTVRAAIAGSGNPEIPDRAYLAVHARDSKPEIVRGVMGFIRELARQGDYFPLTANQFQGLVMQTDSERTEGFENHAKFGALHGWTLGDVRIPKIIEDHGDWAEVELAPGISYGALAPEQKRKVAPVALQAAFAQLLTTDASGNLMINPEMHAGNLNHDADGFQTWLVDCGLVGKASPADVVTLRSVQAAFAISGLTGAAAAMLESHGVRSLSDLKPEARASLAAGLKVFDRQLRAGTSPELLLPGLADLTGRCLEKETNPGLDLLFRALQHLAPYLRETGALALPAWTTTSPNSSLSALTAEIDQAVSADAGNAPKVRRLPAGLTVGRLLRNGSVMTVGVLAQDIDPEKPEESGSAKGMLPLSLAGSKQFLRPADLRLQVEEGGQVRWIPLDEFLAKG